jgi:hypothetical protein
MASSTDIVNRALYRLGLQRINSLSDNNPRAVVMNDLYTQVRDQILEKYYWSFARKRATLSPLAIAPEFGYDYQFDVPADFIKFVEEYEERILYLEDDKILSDESSLEIVYIYRNTDTGKYSPLFNKLLSLHLALEGCYVFTQKESYVKGIIQEIELAELDAFTSNAQGQGEPEDLEYDDLINTRFL